MVSWQFLHRFAPICTDLPCSSTNLLHRLCGFLHRFAPFFVRISASLNFLTLPSTFIRIFAPILLRLVVLAEILIKFGANSDFLHRFFYLILPNLTEFYQIFWLDGGLDTKKKSLLKPCNYLIFNRLCSVLPNLDLNQGPSD